MGAAKLTIKYDKYENKLHCVCTYIKSLVFVHAFYTELNLTCMATLLQRMADFLVLTHTHKIADKGGLN